LIRVWYSTKKQVVNMLFWKCKITEKRCRFGIAPSEKYYLEWLGCPHFLASKNLLSISR
jgi:hypothetical protein